jgi:hypothetical protein
MSDSVRYIHTQAQARAELYRQGLALNAVKDSQSQFDVTEDFIRRQSRVVSNSFMSSDSAPNYIGIQEQAQDASDRGPRDRENAMARARYATKKQRMQEDINYAQKVQLDNARNAKQHRANKRKRIEDDPLHVDAGKDANRMAASRILARANQEAQDSFDREEMCNKVWERYTSYFFPQLMFRISELDAQFAGLEVTEHEWPTPLPDVKPIYKTFVDRTQELAHNFVCASCGCIFHDITELETVPHSYPPLLRHLRVAEDDHVPFDFSCGIDLLDRNRIFIDKLAITGSDQRLYLCRSCHSQLSRDHQPRESLANFRFVRPTVPEELRGLTWIEELLIGRVHVNGRICRLGERHNPSSFFGIKGHVVFLPQDASRLLDLLPMSPASLPEVVKVVWTGKSSPDKSRLRSRFTVRKQKVYNALQWLIRNHADYQGHVIIDEELMRSWADTFVVVELLDTIGRVSDPSAEDASRDGFAMDNPDEDETTDDLPMTSSGILDVNNVAEVPDATTLARLAQLKSDIVINVVTGSKVLNQYDCDFYFTSAFAGIFVDGEAKHRDPRRGNNQLSLLTWVQLMLRNSSR